MRIALFENPDSGSGEAGDVERALRRHGAEVTSFPLDEVDAALATDPDRIVVAGGDGSVGCAAEGAARAGAALAVVPVGTANDFARAMGLPDGLEEATRLAATGARLRRMDLARMGRRPFVNVASLGLAPVAARKASGLKRALGPGAYALGALRAGLTAEPVRCELLCDGERAFAGEAWQATVACSGAFGGGAELDADPHDGLLDAVVIRARSRASLARHAYGLRSGTIGEQPGVHSCRAATIELRVAPGTAFNVDGEVVESGPVRFEVEAAAFDLVVG